MIRQRRANQQGFLLVTVVVILAILASVAMLLSTSASMDNAVLARHVETAELDYTAEAALEHAEWKLAQNSSCAAFDGLPSTPFDAHSYSATVTPTFGSPVALSASATHSSGAMRTLQQSGVKTYQPNTVLTLQPDAAEGKDTRLYEWKSAWNFGSAANLQVSNTVPGDWSNALVEFDLSSIPAAAHIVSATLELYQSAPSASGGDYAIHRVTSLWTEGTSTGGNGSPNWVERDAGVAWTSPGGDYDPNPAATKAVAAALGPNQWEITELVQDWVSGTNANLGMAIVPASAGGYVEFSSSDNMTAGRHPKLTITYACECGVVGASGSAMLQPGAAGKDTYLDSFGSRTVSSHGEDPVITVAESSAKHGLLEFDLTGLPPGAVITNADLEIYLKYANPTPGSTLSAHRVTQAWLEGSNSAPSASTDGASWVYSDAVNSWASQGGDFESIPVAQVTMSASTGWHSLDITAAAADWKSGTQPNYGVLLRPESGFGYADFASSDSPDTSQWPRLTLDFECPCGTTCTVSTGSTPVAKLLLVVADPANLTAQEQHRKALIEGWDYTVTLIAAGDSQAAFDAELATNDVAYITEGIDADALGTKLITATIGVVNEEAEQVNEQGFSSEFIYKIRNEIDVVDNTHYITESFATGLLAFVSLSQQVHMLNAGLAPELRTLGKSFNVGHAWFPSLATLEVGSEILGGGSAAGRRVQLPWGNGGFDSNNLTVDGLTIMKRAIEWGAGAGPVTAPGSQNLLFVVGDTGGLTADEAGHQSLVESWGYVIEFIDDDASSTELDTAIAGNDVVLITNGVASGSIGTKLVNAPIGVVTSENNLSDEFGMASAIAWESGTAIEINDNSHYVTTPFPTGLLTVFSSNESLAYVTGTLSADLSKLASSSSGFGVVALAEGESMYGGGAAAGRRIQLPWGGSGFTPSILTSDGVTILQRALEWGAGAGDTASSGLIAHWKLDETSGTTAMDSVGSNDGTLINSPVWAPGKLDGGLSFDGSNDYIDVSSMNPMSYDDFTVSAWYKSADSGVSDDEYIFEHNENWVDEVTFGPTDDGTDDRLRFGFASGGSGTWDPHYGTSDIVDQEWHHVVGVRSNGRIKLYVDGVEETDGPDAHAGVTITIDGDGPFIGDLPGSTEQVHGTLDDVRLYDRALSATEISALFADGGGSGGGGGGGSPGVLGFDTIFDSSQNNVRRLQIGTQVTLPEDGSVSSITAYVGNKGARNVRYAIYTDVAGEPGALIAESPNALTTVAMQWVTIDLPATPLTAGTYWLALSFHDANQTYHYGSGGQTRYMSNRATDNGFVANWGSSSFSDTRKISIYATYTP